MKRIKVVKWVDKMDGKEYHSDTLKWINALMNIGLAKTNLTGYNNILKIHRITDAIINAKDEILLDDEDYKLLVSFLDYAPAAWGANKNIMKVIKNFKEVGE